jgi:Zn-dependent peptidase ImmA (M78 family)
MSNIFDDAEKDAERVLVTIWSPDASPVRLPVDPVQIAKRLGIDTFETQLDPNVSGTLVKRAGRDPIILINDQDSNNRQRFSCAHELGHYVRRSNQMEEASEEFEYVDLRGPLAAQGSDQEEMYANRFGAALLMPAERVRAFKKASLSVVEMQYAFGVSGDAMGNRLKSLNVTLK